MANNLFNELDDEKKNRIIQAALNEFCTYSYHESSTNRIVKNAEISKGSLFKYFSSKEDLYFYILDLVIDNYTEYLQDNISGFSPDIYGKTIAAAKIEFSWYVSHPEYYSFFKKAFSESQPIYTKCVEKYSQKASDIFYTMFGDVSQLSSAQHKKLDILKWVLEGFNKEFISRNSDIAEIEKLEEKYMIELEVYLNILKLS